MNRIDGLRPDAPDLARRRLHPVGTTDWQVVDHDRIDLVATGDGPVRRGDRTFAVALWYPAADAGAGAGPASYDALLRDGRRRAILHGSARRDPAVAAGRFPLVILSHGYPGSRFLMSHLAEALAAQGYVVLAADHPGSTYDDRAAFGITLLHRPCDQRFLIDAAEASPLAASIDSARTAVIGYSMGGYGALVLAGAGLSPAALAWPGGARPDLLACHAEGTEDHAALADPRLRAIVPIGPWGLQHGFFSDSALAAIGVPMLAIGGSADTVSGYDTGIRKLIAAPGRAGRWLLTFRDAGHNAAAPIPAPAESHGTVDWLEFPAFDHYADAVWDSVRMNNIAQHVVTAFLDHVLQGADTGALLAPFDGGTPPGFGATGAPGVRLEHCAPA